MATGHYTKGATDALDLSVLVEMSLVRLQQAYKKTAAVYGLRKQLTRLKDQKRVLEAELKTLEKLSSGIWSWFSRLQEVARVKRKLQQVNDAIVSWLNSAYRVFAI